MLNYLNKDRQRKIVFYGRVSTEHEAQLSALQNQLQWYDDQLKFHSNWIMVDKYIDEGITGTQAKKRPGFLKMIEDAQSGKFDLIVTREVCRFARNTVDTLLYTRELKNKYGIEVYFVEDNIWTMDGDGELRLTIMATLAQEESRKVSERVRAGQKISRENGVLYGNGNILGYDRDKVSGTYVINKEQAETVRMIYDMYLDGLGAMKIAKELTIIGRKNASGIVKWTQDRIMRVLKRPTYSGIMAYGQSRVDNYLDQKRINNFDSDSYIYKQIDIPVIIPLEDWQKVQEIIESKSRQLGDRKFGKKKTTDLWCQKLVCKCGSSFRKNKWRTNKKDGVDVFGYQCNHQLNHGSKKFREKNGLDTEGYCDVKMIADWKLDMMAKAVIEHIWKDRAESIKIALRMIGENYEDDQPEVNGKDRKEIELQIAKLENRLDNLVEMRADGEISKETFISKSESIKDEIAELRSKLIVEKIESNNKNVIEEKIKEIELILNEAIDFSQPKLSPYIIDRFISKIKVLDNDNYKWYVNLNAENNTVNAKINGRKNNADVQIIDGESNLPCVGNSTGSYQQ